METPINYLITGIAAAAVASGFYVASRTPSSRAKKAGAKLPPGPNNFLLGALHTFPQHHWYETFTQWQQEFGDLVYIDLSVAGVTMLIVNSLEVAEELAGKRKIYSNRPHTTLINDLMYADWTITMQHDGPIFQEQRRILHKCLSPAASAEHDYLVREHVASFVQTISGKTVDPFEALTDGIGPILTILSYGENYDRDHGEEYRKVSLESIELVATTFTKFWAVDLLPILKYVPTWFPGAEFRRIGVLATSMVKKLRFEPLAYIENALGKGNADRSFVTTLLQDQSFTKENIRDVITVMHSSGVDTTASSITNLLYYMAMHPECQKLVHKELDELVGKGVVPSFAEIQQLPYLNAVWKEGLRLRPPVPLGIPHVASEEDVWNGFYIPKGCLVHCNIGFMMRDPRIWGEDSELFKPDRFLDPNAKDLPDPTNTTFGFGRRICPGRFFAHREALQFIAAIFASFKVLPGQGVNLSDLIFEGTVQRPVNFRCRFEPRHGS
ncbi:hypothetical protein M408DRAFT_331669 [Serendipita vermifera MAFF 305830]|uniref:Cytochrome P450 n=1 Tax=Serendipita vermifera MAFF 305830 TaxID=933852 RepID=A0A0C3AJD3_SERVB|nr:hypothetical protein M408DRAFT_331669 [Serendipita vermifera MAFF 305830]